MVYFIFCFVLYIECYLSQIGKPVYYGEYSDNEIGCWMRDPKPLKPEDESKYWLTRMEENKLLQEFDSKENFRNKIISKNYTLLYPFGGNAQAIYSAIFYYALADTFRLIMFNLNTLDTADINLEANINNLPPRPPPSLGKNHYPNGIVNGKYNGPNEYQSPVSTSLLWPTLSKIVDNNNDDSTILARHVRNTNKHPHYHHHHQRYHHHYHYHDNNHKRGRNRRRTATDLETNNNTKGLTKSSSMKNDTGKRLYTNQLNHLDIGADENGIWIVYPNIYSELNNTIVMKFNGTSIEYVWNLTIDYNQIGDTFIMCGILYGIQSVNQLTTNIAFAYDLYNNVDYEHLQQIQFTNPYMDTKYIGYNAKHRTLYTWDNGNILEYLLRIENKSQQQPQQSNGVQEDTGD